MVGDQPDAAPVSGVKRKVMLPEAVLMSNAGSGLHNTEARMCSTQPKPSC